MTAKLPEVNIDSLRKLIIDQATAFLKEAGEFYPFGAAMDKNDELRPIGIYWGEEHPDSKEMIDRLSEALWNGIVRGDYKMAAMGIDVYISDDSSNGKTSAVEIRVVHHDGKVVRYYLPYKLTSSNDPVYGQIIVEGDEN
ncbi:hypothetical protein [Chitinophaga sp. S165]|uniref:hypothetical protein n=1 Tax=Chitinophaga sp. S165 TaxID=2135462 RepID=UPI000D7197B5|nr:hypothetical protein [Chitinophaga sp. S165]PWV56222.1 hypothetical protein C7475_101737 [Chitinophaga sp. S165]